MSESMASVWQQFTTSAFFGIVLTLATFQVGRLVVKKTGIKALNPLVTSIILVIAFLVIFRVDYADYNIGGRYISFLLGPATVAMAIPVYRQVELLKKNWLLILLSVSCGAVAALASIFLMSKAFALDPVLYRSILPKSVTSAIAVGISEEQGAIPAITLLAVSFTGIAGSVFNLMVCKLIRLKDRVAVGLGMGTSAHAIGTSVSLEVGEVEGAMSSLALVVAGLVTVVLAPFFGGLMG